MQLNLPTFLQMESTTSCNMRCTFCPHDKMDKRTPMSDEMIDKVIKECIPTATSCCPFLMGDALLEPRLIEILRKIKDINWKCQTTLYTTMHNATDDLLKQIVEEGLVNHIFVSLYGTEWQRGLDEKKAKENVMKLLEYREHACKRYPTITMMMIQDLTTPEETIERLRKWHCVADAVQIVPFDTFHGDIPEPELGRTRGPNTKRKPCARLWNSFNVHSSGVVVACCIDYAEMMLMGDMNKESAMDIWNGEKFEELRKMHMDGRFDEIPLCKNCVVWERV